MALRLVSGLVAENNFLEVNVTGKNCLNVEIRVSRGDTPRVIGKSGAHFKAIRAVMHEVGVQNGMLIGVPQVLPAIHGSAGDRFPKFKPNPKWPKDEVRKLMLDVVAAATGDDAAVAVNETKDAYKCEVMVKMGSRIPDCRKVDLFSHLSVLFSAIGKTCGVILSFDFE